MKNRFNFVKKMIKDFLGEIQIKGGGNSTDTTKNKEVKVRDRGARNSPLLLKVMGFGWSDQKPAGEGGLSYL